MCTTKKRKRIYSALFGVTLTAATVAASEIITGNEAGIESPPLEAMAFGASGVAFASGVAAAVAIRRRVKSKYGAFVSKETREAATSTERDVVKHIFLLDVPSSGMAFASGAVRMVGNYAGVKYGAQDTLNAADNCIGIASGLWGAYLFRPTAGNLEHHHNHGHHETLTPAAEELVDLRENIS